MVSDLFFTNLIQGSDNNEHDVLESYGKEDNTDTVLDPPFTNLVQGSDINEHDALEGHEKEDITGMISDPLFTNLVQRNDSNKKPTLIGTKSFTTQRVTALCRRRPFVPSGSGGIRMFHYILTLRNTIVLKRRESRSTILDVEQSNHEDNL